MKNTTESSSRHTNLETRSIRELLVGINGEDQTVPHAVAAALPQVEALVTAVVTQMQLGGRLFYVGAGTSGRLGIVDASECPPTFGVPQGLVVGLIAGGDGAIRSAVEFAEDDDQQGWRDLQAHRLTAHDVVVGIAASGRTPYVVGAVAAARAQGHVTGAIVCNRGSELGRTAQFPVEVVVGPEFITGSTRMKAGTAQKLVLNMISTTAMIKLGRVRGNEMVDMQISNAKLAERGARMIMDALGVDRERASALLEEHGSVRRALDAGGTHGPNRR